MTDPEPPRSAPELDRGFEVLDPGARTLPRRARLRIGVGAAIVLVIVALVVTVVVSVLAPRGESRIVAPAAVAAARSPAAASATPARTVAIFVHVLGAVHSPGLYELHSGSRVVDAVAAAGGFAENAEQGGVNLARTVTDGEQLIVPLIGQAPSQPVTAPGGGAVTGGALVNLNTATETDLETLPRIGPALAERILSWREQNGRFASVEDLLNVAGVGDKTFDGLKDLVTV